MINAENSFISLENQPGKTGMVDTLRQDPARESCPEPARSPEAALNIGAGG